MSKLLTPVLVAACLLLTNPVGVTLTAAEKVTENAAVTVMTAEQLQEMLTDLGYEPEQLAPENGATRYSVQIVRNRVEYTVLVTLSRDGKRVSLSAVLDPQVNHADASANTYLKLLDLNNNMGSMAFSLDASGGLRLNRVHDYRSMTPVGLKKALNNLGENITWSEEGWNAVNFDRRNNGSKTIEQHAANETNSLRR